MSENKNWQIALLKWNNLKTEKTHFANASAENLKSAVYSKETDFDEVHIVPINDQRKHNVDDSCRCNPLVEHNESKTLFIHHSFDGREALEEAKEILGLK